MSMESGQFKDAYIKLVTRAWSDDAYRRSVISDPAKTLADAGFEIPEGAQIQVAQQPYEQYENPTLDSAADVWNEGETNGGVYRISLPEAAPVELTELKETELQGLAGGICCSCCCG